MLMEVRDSIDKDSQPVELFNTNSLLAIIYNKMGSPDAAEKIQRESLDLASRKGYLMYEADISKALSDQFRATGNNDSANLYYGKYLFLKDSLEQRHGFNSVERLGFMSQIESINEEVELLSVKRQEERRIRIAVASALVVVIVVLLSLLWIYINLRNSHTKIFIRNEELLRQSEQYRLLLEQSKATVDDIQPKTPQNDTSKEEISDGGEDLDVSDVDTLRQIYARVLAFMEESSAIYEPGFSIYDLSRMVKMSVRNVSKAINSCYKNNFHQLLNDYRIREVRRMMHSREYDNLTIGYIAEKAGFQSRTSFSALFKKMTGLTPSEYIKRARSNPEANE